MATVHNSKRELQYGQPYRTNNPIPGVTAVGPVAVQPDSQHASHHQVIYHYHHQQQQQKPQLILNHSLNGELATTFHQEIYQLPVQHIPQLPPKIWLLIEWDVLPGEPNSYEITDTSQLVYIECNSMETLCTGTNVLVKRGNVIQKASVVTVSTDKQFIDTELMQLQRMGEENLAKRNKERCNRNGMVAGVTHTSKRRRSITPPPKPVEVVEPVETEPVEAEPVEDEPVSPEYDPVCVQSHSQNATANWISKYKSERVSSPASSVRTTLEVKDTLAAQSKQPQMCFDQQSQTSPKVTKNNGQKCFIYDYILAEQKRARIECEQSRQIMMETMQQQYKTLMESMTQQCNTIMEQIKRMDAKINSTSRYEITEVVKHSDSNVGSYVVLETGGEETRDMPTSEEHALSQMQPPNESEKHAIIEGLSLQDDSSMSLDQSKFSVPEEGSSATSTPKILNFAKRPSSSALSICNVSVYSPIGNGSIQINSNDNEVLKDWNDEDGDGNELIQIGSNNTMVKRQVLRAINWTNYKAATRKLLMTLFTREMLSSHTLTGRPSPAFMGDRAKPIKDKLDQRIIADIIAIVTKRCSASEAMVRTAITTKCADENKMSRMKANKASSQNSMARYICNTTVGTPQRSELPPTSPATTNQHSRRVKQRENKENVQ